MTPIYQRPTKAIGSGFTLVELLVVLTIMSMVAAVTIPRLSNKPAYVERETVVAKLQDSIRALRIRARAQGAPVSVDRTALTSISPGLHFTPAIGSGASLILYPDGSSNGGQIDLNGRMLLTIDWLTGLARDAA